MAKSYRSGNVVSKYQNFILNNVEESICYILTDFLAESSKCRVTKMQATPCRLVEDVCKLKRGKNASIEIDFTPGN